MLVSSLLVSGVEGGLIIVLCTKAIIYIREEEMINVADDVRKSISIYSEIDEVWTYSS